MNTGDRIRTRMAQLGMSQAELSQQMMKAGLVHWQPYTVSRTLTGDRPLRLEEALILAQQLDTTVGYLAGEKPTAQMPVAGVALEVEDIINEAISSLVKAKENARHRAHEVQEVAKAVETSQDPDKDILSMQDLADRFGVPVATIRQWRVKGYGPAGFPVGRYVRYRMADVLAWEQNQLDKEAGR